jgi:dolichyl-phosphate beta-glucosyltransferase
VTRLGTVAVVVPAFNEAARLPALLEVMAGPAERVLADAGLELVEIVIVDDGSTDGTGDLLDRERLPLGRVVRLPRNRGKGAAVRAGVLGLQADYVLVTDTDLSTPLEDVVRLTAALAAGADLAIGSRSIAGSVVSVRQPRHRELMGKAFNRLLRLLTDIPFRDTQCGFKLFAAAPARRLFELQRVDGFAFDAELCVNARRLGFRVEEVPVRWADHSDTRVRIVGSSSRMALELLLIAWRARRPLQAPTVAAGVSVTEPSAATDPAPGATGRG